jgi:hydrogenase maturation protease
MSAGTRSQGSAGAPALAGVTLVLGLGNPLQADDGVGWRVTQALAARLADDPATTSAALADVEVDHRAIGGIALMERLVGYRRAVLVGAMVTGRLPPGTVRRLSLAELSAREAAHLDAGHEAALGSALATGRSLGADLPTDVSVVAVEAVRIDEFGVGLSPAVEAAIPRAVDAVLAAIGETGG